jgi:hypothetical protein
VHPRDSLVLAAILATIGVIEVLDHRWLLATALLALAMWFALQNALRHVQSGRTRRWLSSLLIASVVILVLVDLARHFSVG